MPTDARSSAAEPGLRARVEAHLGSHEVARVIYGAIIGLALVLALEAHPPGAAQTAGLLAGTAFAVGLAEIYSEVIGTEARTRRAVSAAELRALWQEAVAVAFGAAFPAAFFVLAALKVMDVDTAFALSKWSGLGLICGYGFVAARLAGAGHSRAVVHAVAVGAIGGILIVLKALLH